MKRYETQPNLPQLTPNPGLRVFAFSATCADVTRDDEPPSWTIEHRELPVAGVAWAYSQFDLVVYWDGFQFLRNLPPYDYGDRYTGYVVLYPGDVLSVEERCFLRARDACRDHRKKAEAKR